MDDKHKQTVDQQPSNIIELSAKNFKFFAGFEFLDDDDNDDLPRIEVKVALVILFFFCLVWSNFFYYRPLFDFVECVWNE